MCSMSCSMPKELDDGCRRGGCVRFYRRKSLTLPVACFRHDASHLSATNTHSNSNSKSLSPSPRATNGQQCCACLSNYNKSCRPHQCCGAVLAVLSIPCHVMSLQPSFPDILMSAIRCIISTSRTLVFSDHSKNTSQLAANLTEHIS